MRSGPCCLPSVRIGRVKPEEHIRMVPVMFGCDCYRVGRPGEAGWDWLCPQQASPDQECLGSDKMGIAGLGRKCSVRNGVEGHAPASFVTEQSGTARQAAHVLSCQIRVRFVPTRAGLALRGWRGFDWSGQETPAPVRPCIAGLRLRGRGCW